MASVPDNFDREDEFVHLFAACQRRLHAYILALVFDHNVAADLLQETNIVLWQKFAVFQPGTDFFAWAREVARISVLRHRQRSRSTIDSMDPSVLEQVAIDFANSPQVCGDDDRQAVALDACLKKLAAPDRELILARYSAGASVSDMAERMNRSANGVSQSLARIRRALADCTKRQLRLAAHND